MKQWDGAAKAITTAGGHLLQQRRSGPVWEAAFGKAITQVNPKNGQARNNRKWEKASGEEVPLQVNDGQTGCS